MIQIKKIKKKKTQKHHKKPEKNKKKKKKQQKNIKKKIIIFSNISLFWKKETWKNVNSSTKTNKEWKKVQI